MPDVENVVEIRSEIWSSCPLCHESIGTLTEFDNPGRVNHLIEEHGYELLHVGQESTGHADHAYQVTVYVLGLNSP